MSYKHLTIKEREILMFLRAKGLSIRAVALRLGRNPSTISRELKRCTGNYSPSKADNLSSKAAELSQEAAIRQPSTITLSNCSLHLRSALVTRADYRSL